MLTKVIRKVLGGLRLFFACLVTIIFVWGIPKDQFTWGLYLTAIGIWMKFEKDNKTEVK